MMQMNESELKAHLERLRNPPTIKARGCDLVAYPLYIELLAQMEHYKNECERLRGMSTTFMSPRY
jgi:hypothetical protein